MDGEGHVLTRPDVGRRALDPFLRILRKIRMRHAGEHARDIPIADELGDVINIDLERGPEREPLGDQNVHFVLQKRKRERWRPIFPFFWFLDFPGTGSDGTPVFG